MAEVDVEEQELLKSGKGGGGGGLGGRKEEGKLVGKDLKKGQKSKEGNVKVGNAKKAEKGKDNEKRGTTGGDGKGKEKRKGEEGEEDEEDEEEEEKPFHFDGEHEFEGVLYPASVPRDVLEKIKDFKFRPDDVVVAGYPKCGTTWIEHVAYLLLYGSEHGESLSHSVHDLTQHSGFLEARVPGGYVPQFLDIAEQIPKPRLIRTHLPYSLLREQLAEAKPKIIVAMRNPKDCLVSYYHFLRNNEDVFGFYDDFDKFFENLVKEQRLTFGDWFDHLLDWWRLCHDENTIFLEFEDMVKDLRHEVQNIVDFLEVDVEEERIEEVTRMSHFKEMMRNPMTQLRIFPFLDADIKRFMRKGEVGDWKTQLNDAQNQYLDEIYDKRIRGTGIELTFELKNNK